MTKHYLHKNWKLILSKSYEQDVPILFDKVYNAQVPGTVHTDLLANNAIEEPFYNDNEISLRWIDECDWSYSTTFDLPDDLGNETPIMLVFDGIDTVSEIKLNGDTIANTDNMFLKYEFDVTNKVKKTANKLELLFTSALVHARKEEQKYGKIPVELNSERAFIRKAQYSFGWDWGPSFPTAGIWKDVYLLQKPIATINDVAFDTVVTDKTSAEVCISANIRFNNEKNYNVRCLLKNDHHQFERLIHINESGIIETTLSIDNPYLWYPNGVGEQNLYYLELQLTDTAGGVIDRYIQKVGIRTIELKLKEQHKDTFQMVVNDKPIFARGVNWIPGDAFLPRVTKEKYLRLLSYAKEGCMNIVRVWGGGIYENDEFYSICDELGLLVWQDFMFACGSYPEHPEMMANIENEVYYQVQRLRNHASIALWCGNNENEWIWSFSQKTPYTEMPGYNIYHKLIPSILNQLSVKHPYWQSSPFGFEDDPNSQTSGNRHQWNVWSHWIDYTEVTKDNSLFVTEFGFQGPATKETFEKYISEEHLSIHSKVFEFHNKQIEGPERILRFLAAHLPLPRSWDDYIYLAQLNQGFALKTCLEHWRTNKTTHGAIIWQINDTWPVTSWALIDSEIKPKIAFHFVKRAFQTALIRAEISNYETMISIISDVVLENISAVLCLYNTKTGIEIKTENYRFKSLTKEITFVSKMGDIAVESNQIIGIVSLYDSEGLLISRNYSITEKWKHISLHDATISYSINGNTLYLTTDSPAYFVNVTHTGLTFDDAGFILLPGETKKLIAENNDDITIQPEKLKITTLNQYLRINE